MALIPKTITGAMVGGVPKIKPPIKPAPVTGAIAGASVSPITQATGAGTVAGIQPVPTSPILQGATAGANTIIRPPQTGVTQGAIAGANTIVRPDGSSYQVPQAGQEIPQIPQTLSTDQLTTGGTFTGIETPQASTSAEGLVSATSTSLESLKGMLEPEPTAPIQPPTAPTTPTAPGEIDLLREQQLGLREGVGEAYAKLGERGQRLEELRQQHGVVGIMEDLQGLNKQIASRSAQFNQALLDNQSRPGLISNIQGRAGLLRRQQSAEIGALTAMAEAMQGNYDMASQLIGETLKVEFEDSQAEIDGLMQQLQFNKEDMTSAEKKEAAKLEAKLSQRQAELDSRKEERQAVFELAMQAAENGADSSTLQSIIGSEGREQALLSAGKFIGGDTELETYAAKKAIDAQYAAGEISEIDMYRMKKEIDNQISFQKTQLQGQADAPAQIEAAKALMLTTDSKLTLLDELLNVVEGGSSSVVGTMKPFVGKKVWEDLTGENQKLLSGISQLISKETLDALITAKQSGATFGALSDTELAILGQAATQLASWAKKDGDGNITHFDISEKEFAAELNKIKDATQGMRDKLNEKIPATSLGDFYSKSDDNKAKIDSLNQMFPDKSPLDIWELIQMEQSGFSKVGSGTNSAPIGKLSEKYESSGRPGAIGYDRVGGTSYGAWQLAHNNANSYVKQSEFANEFSGITFNSKAFISKWKEIAERNPTEFKESQRQYIETTHYAPQAQKIASAGIDLNRRSPALKDVVWSTAVQHGANTRVITDAIARVGVNASDKDLINAIYDRRWSGGAEFGGSTAAVKRSVKNRFDSERRQALAML
jgi:type VI secretion system (T6SS) spike protein VgrG3